MKYNFALYDRKIPLILVFEGMDATGKGGNIKRIRKSLIQLVMKLMVSVPTDVELKHHYLWRFAKDMPEAVISELFDRSWYGRVLVEQLKGLQQ